MRAYSEKKKKNFFFNNISLSRVHTIPNGVDRQCRANVCVSPGFTDACRIVERNPNRVSTDQRESNR